MTSPTLSPTLALQVQRTYAASRERVFRAWTVPENLKIWFGVADGYTTPIAEVDLRVGGRYRLGLKPPDSDDLLIVGGVYREVLPPEKLVFTWNWEAAPADAPDTLVTIEFHERGDSTELVLKHEYFTAAEARDQHTEGWEACLDRLTKKLNLKEV